MRIAHPSKVEAMARQPVWCGSVQRGRRPIRGLGFLLLGSAMVAIAGCAPVESVNEDPDAVAIGAALPFTGESAAIGRNLEQVLTLAVEDVNRASLANGRRFRLVVRDSNSGSERGLDASLELLYSDRVPYLVGPEENALAAQLVPDIKAMDVLNLLPAYSSPSIERVTFSGGAWVRLAPTPRAFACGLGGLARWLGVRTANIVVALDDFNQVVSSDFASIFNAKIGRLAPTIAVQDGAVSYVDAARRAMAAGVDRTLLFVSPSTGATLVTESRSEGRSTDWLLGPMLNTPGYLINVPLFALDDSWGVSPAPSQAKECETVDDNYSGPISCNRNNADAFAKHFAERWDGVVPFPAAHYYYDAVVLLAMGLEYARGRGIARPTAAQLRGLIVESSRADKEVDWMNLGAAFDALSRAIPVHYSGAATDYRFDRYGAATHALFDTWHGNGLDFVTEGTLRAICETD